MTESDLLALDTGPKQTGTADSLPTTPPRLRWGVVIGLGGWIMLAFVIGFSVRSVIGQLPGTGSPEVGFARDMIVHHANAVEMAILLRDRTDDPEMRMLALDIMLTQQAQIGQMQGWLAVWQQPIAQTEPAMAWMGMPTEGLMPGLATAEQMDQLRNLTGREVDGLFLNLMIPHHQVALEMATVILDQTRQPEVRSLAESILISQASEIEAMQDLLQRKGFPVVNTVSPLLHGKHNE